MKRLKRPVVEVLVTWFRRQPPKTKVFLGVLSGIVGLAFIRLVVEDQNKLFIASETIHALGISFLIYKIKKEKSCAGLSLKSQELTAIFLAVRLYCSYVMEYNIHTLLDFATFSTTLWVIYMIRSKLRSTYMNDKDTLRLYYLVIPCALLGTLIHPKTRHNIVNRVLWSFCVYLEAVSVLPQLTLMQKTKIIEPFTAFYIFALGVARFLNCAHWILQVYDSREHLLLALALGNGLWPYSVLLSEIVQTLILSDFCYYYVKSVVGGHLVLRLPSSVV